MFWAPTRAALGRSGWGFFGVSRRVVFCDLSRVDGTGILSPGCLLGGFQGGSRVWDGFLPFFLFSPPLFPLFSIFKRGEVFAAAGGIFFFFWGGASGGFCAGLFDVYWGPVFLGLFVWCEWVSVSLVLASGFSQVCRLVVMWATHGGVTFGGRV